MAEVLLLAVSEHRQDAVIRRANEVAATGVRAVLVTVGVPRRHIAETVEHVDLLPSLQRILPCRVLLARPARFLAARRGRDGGRHATWTRWTASARYARWQPFLLWRAVRRSRLDLTSFTHVVVTGVEGWTIAWHVSRKTPDVVIASDLNLAELSP